MKAHELYMREQLANSVEEVETLNFDWVEEWAMVLPVEEAELFTCVSATSERCDAVLNTMHKVVEDPEDVVGEPVQSVEMREDLSVDSSASTNNQMIHEGHHAVVEASDATDSHVKSVLDGQDIEADISAESFSNQMDTINIPNELIQDATVEIVKTSNDLILGVTEVEESREIAVIEPVALTDRYASGQISFAFEGRDDAADKIIESRDNTVVVPSSTTGKEVVGPIEYVEEIVTQTVKVIDNAVVGLFGVFDRAYNRLVVSIDDVVNKFLGTTPDEVSGPMKMAVVNNEDAVVTIQPVSSVQLDGACRVGPINNESTLAESTTEDTRLRATSGGKREMATSPSKDSVRKKSSGDELRLRPGPLDEANCDERLMDIEKELLQRRLKQLEDAAAARELIKRF